jgi:hypothetical protein
MRIDDVRTEVRTLDESNGVVHAGASALGKISARKRLGHLSPEQRSEWGRRLGQIWRDSKASSKKAAQGE